MAIQTAYEKDIEWNYYLTLVEELKIISNYIEFDKGNYRTYSTELSKILMAASAEVDVVMKQLCNQLDKKRKHREISHYRETIRSLAPQLIQETVHLPLHGLKLKPWINWANESNPDWWKAYTNVKHERNKYYPEATLKNALNAVAALYVCLFYLKAVVKYRDAWDHQKNYALSTAVGNLVPRSSFFKSSHLPDPLIPID